MIPRLAAGTTFVHRRMMQQPTGPVATGLELQARQCFSIIQQCFVTGWAGLRPEAA